MMKLKRTIVAALALTLGACLVTGCVSDDGEGGENAAHDQTGAYTITFDANGGTFASGKTLTFKTDDKLTAFPQNPTRVDYTFDAWNTQSDGNGSIVTLATTYSVDTTLYAQWKVGGESGGENNDQGDGDNNVDYGNGDGDNNYGYGDSSDVTFVFSTGWDAAITDVRIHLWGDGGDYTTYIMDDWLDVGGDLMTDNYDGTYSYSVTPDSSRGDVIGAIVTFTQDGNNWIRAKSTECLYSFSAGTTYNLMFDGWNNDVYGTIDWATWAVVPFNLSVQ